MAILDIHEWMWTEYGWDDEEGTIFGDKSTLPST